MTEATAAVDLRRVRVAEGMLLLTTAVWGASFALAKEAGDAINRGAGDGRALGPILVLALRFTLGAICMAVIVAALERRRRGLPDARRDAKLPFQWTRLSAIGGATVGGLLAFSSIVQHLSLERTSEATAAFLTSLTVVFVPLAIWLARGPRPGGAAWAGVALAVPGVWLMSGARPGASFGLGEVFGLACAIGYSWHLLAVNKYSPTLGSLRLCAIQFAVVGVACWPLAIGLAMHADHFDAAVVARPIVWGNVLLLVAGPTLVSFGLMAVYQPRVAPVRAVLIYLTEPIFAGLFAWLWTGRAITSGEVAGGALILLANVIVEVAPSLWPKRVERESKVDAP